MLEWLQQQGLDPAAISPRDLALRLVLSLVFGSLVAGVYRLTRHPAAEYSSFAGTLVLLSILIAIVTQVIGDNVARAFSLVGALSIVRFRTVVQDTRDTAFVIFAVVTGMAVGAANLLVAVSGLIVVAAAAWIYRPRTKHSRWQNEPSELSLKLAMELKLESCSEILSRYVAVSELTQVETAQRGAAIEYVYRLRLLEGADPAGLVLELNRIEGVQSVHLKQKVD